MSKHANVEIGLALRADRWAGADFWEQQARRVTFEDILRRSEVVTVGIDGGGLDDLLGCRYRARSPDSRMVMLVSCMGAYHRPKDERAKFQN